MQLMKIGHIVIAPSFILERTFVNTSDSFDTKVTARNLQIYSWVTQRNREKADARIEQQLLPTRDVARRESLRGQLRCPFAGHDGAAFQRIPLGEQDGIADLRPGAGHQCRALAERRGG